MKSWLPLVALLALLPAAAAAQQIPVKTVPVATGGQFVLFPSQNAAMGGVAIALDDPWHDPFTNPARGIYTQGLRFTSTPVFYDVSMDENRFLDGGSSSGRTLPMGLLMRQGTLYGGAMMAWQSLNQDVPACCFRVLDRFVDNDVAFDPPERSISQDNVYGFGMVGAQVPGTNVSVGASVFTARLNGLEGVQLLYVDGERVKQHGTMSTFRLGAHLPWDNGRSADLVVLHHRFTMEHELPPLWGPCADCIIERTEQDETRGVAVQATYRHPLGAGWRLGARLAGDWKWHPKIPNYDLMQIPRDPGNSWAYNVGLGAARQVGTTTFGVDVIYEPIWSHTWANALTDMPLEGGAEGVIPAGEKTVDNDFRFHNSLVRLGVRNDGDRFFVGLGLSVHSYRYHLDQDDFLRLREREQDEHWSEWTGSLGLGLTFPAFQVRYLGLLTLGTGRPGIDTTFQEDGVAFRAEANDILIAPAGGLTLQDARVVTHQITVIVPITD